MATVAIIGPGAIGGAFGGALLEAGHTVLAATRTPFETLRVEHPRGRIEGRVAMLDLDSATTCSFVVLATKAHQTDSAGRWLAALCGPRTVLTVLQNGVEHLERVAPLVHPAVEIVPAMVACPSERRGPGVVVVTGPARLELPESDAARHFAALFATSYAEVRTVVDWQSAAWRKLVLNAAGGGIGTITRRGNEVLRDPVLGAWFLAIAAEVVAVGRAEGARLADDVPDRTLDALRSASHSHLPSIVVDRLASRPTEWQARNEVVVRKARIHGIAVPNNELLVALLRAGEPSPHQEPHPND